MKPYMIIDENLLMRGCPPNADPKDPMSAGWLLFEGNKKNCKEWILDGLYKTEGAEQEHYVNMLRQLDMGKKTIGYWGEER